MGKIKKILEKELGSTQSVEVYPITSIEAVYGENNERLDNIINRKNNETQKELKAEVARATNAESNLRETINNITEINENATSANIVTIDTIPNTSSSNVQQALNELFKNATFAGIATPTTNPGTPDGSVFYFANKEGTYTNFNGIKLSLGESSILKYSNGAWEKILFPATSSYEGNDPTQMENALIYVLTHNGNTIKPMTGFDAVINDKNQNLTKVLQSLSEEAVGYKDFEDIKGRLSVAQNNKILVNGVVTNRNGGFITTPLQVYKGDTVKITAHYYPSCDAIAIDNGDGTYTKVATGSSSSTSSSTATLQWTAPKDCMVVFSGIDWDAQYNVAKIFLLRSSKVETKVNRLVWKKRIIEFNTELTPGLPIRTLVTLGQTFPFGGHGSQANILRGIFEVKEGEKVYFSTLPYDNNNFSGCAVLDKDYIVISLMPASNDIYFEVSTGGKYIVFQTLTASGYPTIYVESLEDTTEEIDTTDLELLQNPTIDCLQNGRAYIFGDVGTKVTESDNWIGVNTTCYSCVPGDVFYITSICTRASSIFAVVSENNVILAKDTRPTGFWHYMTKVVVPEGGAKLLVNNDLGNLCVYKKKATRDIYPEKEPLVAATSLATVGSNYSDRRLRLSWASDTHGDNNLYKRWIDWTNRHIGMFDAALHTGDFNRMADADNGFVVTALKYHTMLPFLPTLGNHDCFGYTTSTNTLNSGSLEWNGNKYIKPFVENDSACVVSNDGCYYYRDFTDKKIRMIVINDYDKPRWADGTYWITTTDESEIASAVEWTSGTSYAVGDVVHYKGMYVKCKTAGALDDKAHVWRPDRAVLSKTITDCRYISQAQADFIINAMNVDSGWGIIFVTHQPYEALPASEHCISKWTLRRDLVSTYVGVKFGQNGYMIQDLITAYLNKTTLNKTYECITPNVNPLASNVVKTNLPDFYPDVTIDVDFTNAVGDVICCLNGHQHSDTAYWSQHTGEKKVLCVGAPTDCYLPFDSWSNPWPSGDIAKNGGAKDCFNVISIDTTEKAIYLVRIGADKTDQFETRDYIRISYAHN